MLKLGVIGYGGRIQSVLGTLHTLQSGARVTAIADPRADRRRDAITAQPWVDPQVAFYADAGAMLDGEALDGVMVGTRGYLHTAMACQVLARHLPLYLEKPVGTTLEELTALQSAYRQSRSPVVVSFPLRVTPLLRLAKEIVDSGQIGTVEHIQANNNVPYGGVYYHYFYRDPSQDGSLWLAKTTHDFDYLNHLLGLAPTRLAAIESKQIFKGDYPAGLACSDCADQHTCLESPYNQFLAGEIDAPDQPAWQPYLCSFAVDTGNHDSASVLIQYASGMHVAYSQNFFARKDAAKRGAVLMGYRGTLEFDWYTSELKVYMHHTPRTERHRIDVKGGHLGGDFELARNWLAVLQGEAESVASLDAGILSALMCLKAAESAATGTFQEIHLPQPIPA